MHGLLCQPLIAYLGKVTHLNKKNGKEYHTHKVGGISRTEKGKIMMPLNLGTDLELPKEKQKQLTDRIESIISGRKPLFFIL